MNYGCGLDGAISSDGCWASPNKVVVSELAQASGEESSTTPASAVGKPLGGESPSAVEQPVDAGPAGPAFVWSAAILDCRLVCRPGPCRRAAITGSYTLHVLKAPI